MWNTKEGVSVCLCTGDLLKTTLTSFQGVRHHQTLTSAVGLEEARWSQFIIFPSKDELAQCHRKMIPFVGWRSAQRSKLKSNKVLQQNVQRGLINVRWGGGGGGG